MEENVLEALVFAALGLLSAFVLIYLSPAERAVRARRADEERQLAAVRDHLWEQSQLRDECKANP